MSFFSSLFGKGKATVTVPPGHKVVVVHPAAKAYFGRGESGVWVDLGTDSNFTEVVSGVAQVASMGQQASIVWILQPNVLDSPSAFDSFINSLNTILQQSRGVVSHCAVVPNATAQHISQMRRLRTSGIGVHFAAADGACFVEVHKPEGITVGMPGAAFEG